MSGQAAGHQAFKAIKEEGDLWNGLSVAQKRKGILYPVLILYPSARVGLHTRDMGKKKRKVDGREVAPDLLAPVLDFESLHHVVQRQLSDEYYHHTVIKTTFATFIKYAVIAAKIRDCVEVVSKRT